MADGTVLLDPGDATERDASAADAALIRRVRWRLVGWSGGSTLLVLILLGAALYAAVAFTLTAASVGQLSDRVDPVADALEGRVVDPDDSPNPFGVQFGAGNTFLFAFDDRGNPVQLNRGPAVGIPSYTLASLIAASRLAKHAHHLSDVFGGAALGQA